MNKISLNKILNNLKEKQGFLNIEKLKNINKIKVFVYSLFVLLGVFISIISYTLVNYYQAQHILKITELENKKSVAQIKALQEKQKIEKMIIDQNFNKLKLDAKNILVKDLTTKKEIFSKEADKKVGLASLTKIATLAVALNNSPKNIIIKAPFLLADGDNGLVAGENFNTKKLLELMFMVSSNDAATAIAYKGELKESNHQDFLKKMNTLADKLGIKSTIFLSESGLDIDDYINGSYGSAKDISSLSEYVYKTYPDFIKEVTVPTKKICSKTICHDAKNTDPLLIEYPNIVFSKTGWTHPAGGNLSLIYKINNNYYSIVILGSTKQGRFNDAKLLIKALKNYVIQKNKN